MINPQLLIEENRRLKYWLKEIIRFYESGSDAKHHAFSLRQAKKLLEK